MKISKINFNGTSIPINDPDSVQLPDGVELEDGDVLVYDEDSNSFIAVNKNNLVEVEKGVVENSTKLVTSGDVYNAIDAATTDENFCKLNISYDSLYNKLVFGVAQDSPFELQVEVSLLVMSINTSYNSQQEEFKFSNIVDILHLTPFTTSVEKPISVYSEDRQFYFVLINNSQRVQSCELNTDTILIPGVNEKTNITITGVTSTVANKPVLILTASNLINTDINVNLRLDNLQGEVKNITALFASGTSSKTIELGSSSYTRQCNISITPAGVSETQNYVLQTTSCEVTSNLTRVAIRAIADDDNTLVHFTTVNEQPVRENIDIQLWCPRSGTSSLILRGSIVANSNTGSINYGQSSTGQAFTGYIVGVTTGENNKDDLYEYYIESSPITLVLDCNGDPYQ